VRAAGGVAHGGDDQPAARRRGQPIQHMPDLLGRDKPLPEARGDHQARLVVRSSPGGRIDDGPTERGGGRPDERMVVGVSEADAMDDDAGRRNHLPPDDDVHDLRADAAEPVYL
jgi:hypothetical protein